MECSFLCPCCNNQLKLVIDNNGNIDILSYNENFISQKKLSEICGIELGIIDNTIDNENKEVI